MLAFDLFLTAADMLNKYDRIKIISIHFWGLVRTESFLAGIVQYIVKETSRINLQLYALL